MSWIGKLLAVDDPGPPHPAKSALDDYWYEALGRSTAAGERVSPELAIKVSTVYRCCQLIAGSGAKLPLILYEQTEMGKERAKGNPLYSILRRRANDWQSAFEWKEMMLGHVFLRGNAYSEIIDNDRGEIEQLVPLHPARMKPKMARDGGIRYVYRLEDGTDDIYLPHEIFHLRGPGDGIEGRSFVNVMAETIGLARAAEAFQGEVFSRAPMMAGFLTNEGTTLGDPARQKEVGDELRKAHAGRGKWHGVAVLQGLKWQATGMSLKDAQHLELRNYTREDIATFAGVPFHKAGVPGSTSYASIEQENLSFVIDCLGEWLGRFEARISMDLIDDPERFFAEFLYAALLRGTARDQAETFRIATGGRAWMSPDEVRESLNMNRRGGVHDEIKEGLGNTQVDKAPSSQPGGGDPKPPAKPDPKKNGAATAKRF